jgi:hypothetical protein
MSTTRRAALLATLIALGLTLTPTSAEAARTDHLRLDIGGGAGVDYAMAGVMGGVDLRIWRGMGFSAAVGVGTGISGSVYTWSPGERVRFGLGASVWRSWDQLTYQDPCCYDGPMQAPPPGAPGPGPNGPPGTCVDYGTSSGAFAASIQTALDHDFGAPSGWAIRYGLGLGVVATGGAGAVLPAPSVGVRYAF